MMGRSADTFPLRCWRLEVLNVLVRQRSSTSLRIAYLKLRITVSLKMAFEELFALLFELPRRQLLGCSQIHVTRVFVATVF